MGSLILVTNLRCDSGLYYSEPKMSNYFVLDTQCKNCPSCIGQRELEIPNDHGGHGGKEEKKTSQSCEKRKISGSRTPLVRRSNSSLSFSSEAGVLKKENSFDGSTYLTPTQRKNQEIKQMRLELTKANALLQTRDKEISALRREVCALEKSEQKNESWKVETGSITDSGNCEESCSTSWDQDREVDECPDQTGHKLENIDLELMETSLKEDEETRHKLEVENKELKDELIDVRRELAFTKDQFEDETSELKKIHEDGLLELKKENGEKIAELVNELAKCSLRCGRQQDTLEQKQNRLDDILKELSICKENLLEAKEKIKEQEESLAKAKANVDEQPNYLNLVTEKASNISVQSKNDPEDTSGVGCQTDKKDIPSMACEARYADYREIIEGDEAIVIYPKNKEENTCDNEIHLTYQFLKRSIYYFITDKEHSAYHLKSIERLLEFSDLEHFK